uniref:Uncharacterized protein n=1 Tax=Populus trichocarpa TaxID=3694 RepID=U5FQL4_POPTR
MEADDLSVLHKSLFEDKLSATDLFLQKLCSDTSIKSALQRFYSILKRGVSLIDDDANNSERKLGFQLWTDSQIQSVVSLGIAIVSSSRSLSGLWWICKNGLLEFLVKSLTSSMISMLIKKKTLLYAFRFLS